MHPSGNNPALRMCVIIPTYNNARTLVGVIQKVREVVTDVIVVNDGSSDNTESVLADIAGIIVLTQLSNSGKGAALARGLDYATARKYTHAITMDADGQHSAADLPAMLQSIQEHPNAIVIGVRHLPQGRRPLKSRLLRVHSNFWVWVETGRWIADTQSGFRVYPLVPISQLFFTTKKYDFEMETLVKATWAGVPSVQVPVTASYGVGSESHFRPFHDFALVFWLNSRLVIKHFFLPPSLLASMHTRAFHDKPGSRLRHILYQAIFHQCDRPGSFAICVGLGVFFGILPIWGFQMVAAIAVAHRFRLSKPLVVAASNISLPVMIPLIVYASIVMGHLLLTGQISGLPQLQDLQDIPRHYRYAVEYLFGSVALAVISGLAAALLAYLTSRLILMFRKGETQ